MAAKAVKKAKAWRIVRQSPAMALRRFVEPIFNAGQLLTFAAASIGLYLALKTATDAERDQQAIQWAIAIQATGVAFAGWLVLSTLSAPFLVWHRDRSQGTWDGNVYVYNEPFVAGRFRISEADGEVQTKAVTFSDVEPGAYVTYSVVFSPPVVTQAKALIILGQDASGINWKSGWFAGNGAWVGTRLPKSREATLAVNVKPGTIPFVCTVLCHHFYVGI